ncbi:MAG: hypothetical protein HN509_17660 [Halobacteriovoraceae bacterium]|jgi:hypothetical protein|nr:hypothetical protein [Halobacteriovoraceae bacterium]MBT5094666.1 hypothetical protein [Halobacteriovoraceae bacterium]
MFSKQEKDKERQQLNRHSFQIRQALGLLILATFCLYLLFSQQIDLISAIGIVTLPVITLELMASLYRQWAKKEGLTKRCNNVYTERK